jgi:hypothetical protein
MKPKVYLETTIPSYLTAWTSRDLVMAAHQQVTREWWDTHRAAFDLFISQLVLQEAAGGDAAAAARRLELLRDFPILGMSEAAAKLAEELVLQVPLPERAALDALHIAVAVVNGMDYLLTWNCKHIANAVHQARIGTVCRSAGYEPSVICTPEALLEGETDATGSGD